MKLDGVNDDGVSGWDLLVDDGVLIVRHWHCDYVDSIRRPATTADLEELLASSWREWPTCLPRSGPYRDRRAMIEWDTWLRSRFCGQQLALPMWWRDHG